MSATVSHLGTSDTCGQETLATGGAAGVVRWKRRSSNVIVVPLRASAAYAACQALAQPGSRNRFVLPTRGAWQVVIGRGACCGWRRYGAWGSAGGTSVAPNTVVR